MQLLSLYQTGLPSDVSFTHISPRCPGEQRIALAELQHQQLQWQQQRQTRSTGAAGGSACPVHADSVQLQLLPPAVSQPHASPAVPHAPSAAAAKVTLGASGASAGHPAKRCDGRHRPVRARVGSSAPAPVSAVTNAGAQTLAAAAAGSTAGDEALQLIAELNTAEVPSAGAATVAGLGLGAPSPTAEDVDHSQLAALVAALAPLAAVAPLLVELVRTMGPPTGADL